jgi:tripartite-type tricarboxylate transporter receptor subunit TctC
MPVRDLKEFAAALKAKPEAYNYASSGNGTVLHLADELLIDEIGVKATHVPYNGTAPMITGLMGGQVDWGIVAVPAAAGQIKQGTLKATAVPSAKRTPALADVPTAAEQGFAGFMIEGWFGVVGPAKMPADKVKRLHAAIVNATQMADVRETLVEKQGTSSIR